jgi:hypothetical protein
MKSTQFYLLSFLTLSIISLILNRFFSLSSIASVFFYSFIFHVLVSLYAICSLYEISVLHEKQGSKLILSKNKITSEWR